MELFIKNWLRIQLTDVWEVGLDLLPLGRQMRLYSFTHVPIQPLFLPKRRGKMFEQIEDFSLNLTSHSKTAYRGTKPVVR